MDTARYGTDKHFKLWVRKDGATLVSKFTGTEEDVVKYMRHIIKDGGKIHGCQYVVVEDRYDLVPAIGDQASHKRTMIADIVDFDL